MMTEAHREGEHASDKPYLFSADSWERNKKYITGGLIVVLLGVAGFFYYRNSLKEKNACECI